MGFPRGFSINDLKVGQSCEFQYESGVIVRGILIKVVTPGPEAYVLTLDQATCTFQRETLFKPDWGLYDIVLAHEVTSVFGGPADRNAYGEVDDFVASRVHKNRYSDEQLKKFSLYQQLRDMRNGQNLTSELITKTLTELKEKASTEWLLFLELYEMAHSQHATNDAQLIESELKKLAAQNPAIASQISEGLKLAHAEA